MVKFHSNFLWKDFWKLESEIDWKHQLKFYRIIVVSFLFGFFFAILLCLGSYKVAKMIIENEVKD